MADLKITQLPEETGTVASTFPLAIVNVTAAETRKITTANLATAIFSNLSAGGLAASKIAAGYSGASLTDGTVTNAKLVNSSINFGGVSVALGGSDAHPAFNLQDATGYPASALTGTITNAQLAGSIAISKLASSAVSFGGISVNLGSADATPAFDLTDATNYKTTNLVGTITNAQLAGSIDVSKLVGSNVSFGGVTVALGASDPHPAFDLQDATGYKTTNLVGTITNAQLAGSIDASKLVADSLTSTQLGANCVGASELANNAVDSGAVQTGAIVNDKIETSSSSTTGIDGATKLRAGSVPASKLDASTVGNGLAINSNVLSINNTITGATSLGLTFSNQGICTGIAALQASDLSGVLATASAVGVVKVPSSGGLSVSGSGDLSLASTVTAHTTRGIAVNAFGQVTSVSATVPSASLPVASTTAVGGIKVPSTSSPLTVDGNGILTIGVSGVTAGTGFTKFNVNDKGLVTSAGAITAAEIPNISAALLTSGTLNISRIANNAIGGALLSDASTTLFGGPGSTSNIVTFPTASFKGQRFWDEYHGDEYIWTGSSWQAVTITGGELIYGGTYNAASGQNKVASVTTAGAAAGLQTGSGLPTPSATNIRVYVVVSDSGTGTGNAPNVALAPPDMLVSNGTNSWDLVDVSNAIAGQTASNISFTPYQNLASTNAQAVIQELDDEKVGKAGINVITGTLEIGTTGILKFEGSTANAYETTLQNIDPLTADRVLSLPDNTGTLVSTGSSGVVTSAMITDATIVNSDISATASIALSKIAVVSPGQILVGASGTGAITAVTVSGDIALTSAGAFSYVAGSIVNADINASAGISASKIDAASTSQAGCVQLSSATTSTSATKAATPAAVKIAKDAADAAQATATAALPKSGGALTGNLTLNAQTLVRFADSDSSNFIALKAPATIASDITLTLPSAAPAANQILKANGSTPTTLEWAADASASSLPLAGGTMQGAINMGANNITNGGTITGTFVGNVTGNISGTSGGFTAGNASNLNSGTVATARLGSGTASSSNFLRGDNTWQTIDLTALSASNLTSGTVPDARFPSTLPAVSGANLTALNASNISSGTIAAARVPTLNQNTTGTAATVTGSSQSAITSLGTLTGLTVDGDVTLTGAANNVVWDKSDNAFEFADNAKATFGASSDLQIYHDGNNSALNHNGTGDFYVQSNNNLYIRNIAGDNYIRAIEDGAVELYHNGTKKAETSSAGLKVVEQILVEGTETSKLNGNQLRFERAGASYVDQIGGGNLVLRTMNSGSETTALTIDTSQNATFASGVGCGAAPGGYKLQVTEGTGNEIARFSGANGANLVFRNATSNEMLLYVPSADSLKFATNGYANVALTLDSSQNATFAGSINAQDFLNIQNGTGTALSVSTVGDFVAKFESTDGYAAIVIEDPNSTNDGNRVQVVGDNLYLITGGTTGLTLDSSQNATFAGTVTATSFSGSGANLTNLPASGGTVTGTASGSLTANRAVLVQSDGTFKQPGIVADNVSSEVTAQASASLRTTRVIYIEDNKYVVGYQRSGNLRLKVATVSGTTVSYGSEVDAGGLSGGNFWDAAWSGTHLLIARTGNSSGHMYRRNATISGTTISLGTDNYVNNGGAMGEINVNYNKDKSKFLIFYRRDQTNQYVIRGSNSDGSSGFFGPQNIISTNTNYQCFTVRYHEYIKTHVMTYTEQDSNKRQYIGVCYLDGSNNVQHSSFNNLGNNAINQANGGRTGLAFQPNSARIVCFFPLSPSSTQVLKAEVFDITQSTITGVSGGLTLLSAGNSSTASRYSSVTADYDSTLDRFIVSYRKGVTSGRPYITSATLASNGGSFSNLTTTEVDSDTLNDNEAPNVFYRHTTATGKGLVTYIPSAQAYVQSRVFSLSATDLDADRFIGFASAGYSNGQTATVNVVSGTTTQSSLTPGVKYYVQADGTVGTSAITPSVLAGTAISSTKILIKG